MSNIELIKSARSNGYADAINDLHGILSSMESITVSQRIDITIAIMKKQRELFTEKEKLSELN